VCAWYGQATFLAECMWSLDASFQLSEDQDPSAWMTLLFGFLRRCHPRPKGWLHEEYFRCFRAVIVRRSAGSKVNEMAIMLKSTKSIGLTMTGEGGCQWLAVPLRWSPSSILFLILFFFFLKVFLAVYCAKDVTSSFDNPVKGQWGKNADNHHALYVKVIVKPVQPFAFSFLLTYVVALTMDRTTMVFTNPFGLGSLSWLPIKVHPFVTYPSCDDQSMSENGTDEA